MSNSFVISGLTAKRAELAGEIGVAEKRLDQLRAELASLDATIRLFDPSIAPKATKPKVKRTTRRSYSGQASLPGRCWGQAEKPLTVREVAERVSAERHLDMSTIEAANVVIANARAALARPHEGLLAEKRGKEPMVYRVG